MNENQTNDESVSMGVAPSNVTDIGDAKKPNKIDFKRQQAFKEKLQRTMKANGCDEKTAFEKIQKDAYESMPAKEHVKRLEALVFPALSELGQNIQNLRNNDGAIADSFDINYHGISALFVEYHVHTTALIALLAGKHHVSVEALAVKKEELRESATKEAMALQSDCMKKAQEAFLADREARMQAHMAAQKQQQEEAAKARVTTEVDESGTPPPPPDGATEFGG